MMKTRVNGTVRPEMDAGLRRGIAAAAVLLIVCVLAVGVVSADEVTVSSFGELQSNISTSGDRTIIVSASFPITSQLTIDSGNITLTTDGADHTLSRNCEGYLFIVNSGGNLTITGNFTQKTNLTLDGMQKSSAASLVLVNSGSFTLADGGILTNNTAFSGGGVYVYNSGTFTMSGGEISGNEASYGGGGVYVDMSGTFTMSGGTISDNTASNTGGGVYVMSDGSTFEMSGGTISGNTADDGGGVCLSSGTFTMSGDAVISGNEASYGGGVCLSSGTFTMSGDAVISGNTADDGGGVYLFSGTFTMSDDAVISGNTASYGGGVCLSSGTFTMSGGELSGNTASYGGELSGNTASYGGGVYLSSGTFTMSGGELSGNTASYGGGVYMFGSSRFELSGSGSTDSVYLASRKSITVIDALTGTDNQVTGIELQRPADGTTVVTGSLQDDLSRFELDPSVTGFKLAYQSSNIVLEKQPDCTVQFDAQGGSPKPADVTVPYGGMVTEPKETPTMTGYTFTGWYKEEECTNQWDFDTDTVTGDITLYAGWKKDEPGPDQTPVPPSGGSSGDGNMENAFRVLFNDGATTLTVQTDLSYGDKLTKPEDPVKDGYTFAGWYKDSACTQGWDFETGIPGDMTLYAKWTAIEATPTATATATATAVTTPQPTATQTTAAATSVPEATTAAGVSPTLTQAPAPVAGALFGLLAAGLLLRRRFQ